MAEHNRPAVIQHWIDGKFATGTSGRTAPVTNPATGAVTGEVALASVEEAGMVVASAAATFFAWRNTSLAKRTQVVFAFRELLNARKGELAEIITAEHGKVVSDAVGEVSRGQEVVEFACGIAHLMKGEFTENAVDELLRHPEIKAISFVGSTPIARYVYETGTAHGKRVQALGGAKNHMVVLPDADPDLAADAAVNAGFGSAGERCMAISALVAVGEIADELVSKIVERVAILRTGDGRTNVDMGPLVTQAHLGKVVSYVEAGETAGATLVVDGRAVQAEGNTDGFWLGPTLFDHLTPEMSIYTDEIFGPVLSVLRVDTYGQALELINANPYGNGTAIFTNDGGAARRFQNRWA